jgi:hypothetical protein
MRSGERWAAVWGDGGGPVGSPAAATSSGARHGRGKTVVPVVCRVARRGDHAVASSRPALLQTEHDFNLEKTTITAKATQALKSEFEKRKKQAQTDHLMCVFGGGAAARDRQPLPASPHSRLPLVTAVPFQIVLASFRAC